MPEAGGPPPADAADGPTSLAPRVDGSIAIVQWGVGEAINNIDIKDSIAAFVFNNKGLMFNLTLE